MCTQMPGFDIELKSALADYHAAKSYAQLYPSSGRQRAVKPAKRLRDLLRARRRCAEKSRG